MAIHAQCCAQPGIVVLSQSMARKYFGDADPIGKTISPLRPPGAADRGPICDNSTVPLKVTGVMRDLPHNTQLYADMLIPNTSIVDRIDQETKHNLALQQQDLWLCGWRRAPIPPRCWPSSSPSWTVPSICRAFTNVKMAGSQIMEVRLVPFRDAHLTTDQYFAMRPPGSWTTLYGMGAIGILILLVACFNFMNLATARATMRAREISLRKCVGATRGQLIDPVPGRIRR